MNRLAPTLLLLSAPALSQTELHRIEPNVIDDRAYVLGGEDLDGDLVHDVVIGVPGDDTAAWDAGAVYAYSGRTGAQLWAYYGAPGSWLGHALVFWQDENADGVPEIAAGAPFEDIGGGNRVGMVQTLDGATGAWMGGLSVGSHGDGFGWALASGFDWNGDGDPDLAVGAPYDDTGGPNAGRVTFVGGTSIFASVTGSGSEQLGYSIAAVPDVDGNVSARPDVAIGAPYANVFSPPFFWNGAGRVYVYSTSSKSIVTTLSGSGTGNHFGWSLAGLPDVDADGLGEVLVGEPDHPGVAPGGGRVTLRSAATAVQHAAWFGDAAGDALGTSLAVLGDLDGDGTPDFVAGAPRGASQPGYARVYSSGPGTELFTLQGSTAGDGFGRAVASVGDVNYDGERDLAVVAPDHAGALGADAGAVFVFSGAGPGFVAYCTAGTSASGCTATLSGLGVPSASAPAGFLVLASEVEGAKDGLFFFGTQGRQAGAWGNGTSFQCVVPPVKRGGLLAGQGTAGACDGLFAQDLNARWQAQPGQNPGPGAIVQTQLWHRDPLNTSNRSTSLSSALEFVVGP